MALTKTPIELSSTPGIVDNSNNTAITINSSENVGIGIGLPASLLDVASTGEVTSTVRSTSTSGARQATLRLNVASTGGDDPAGRVQFTYGTGYTVAGSIEMTHTNPAMKFLTGTTERIRILPTGGITFNGDTAQANALDDYEEGTFNATATGTGTLSVVNEKYTKIGNVVTVYFQVNFSGASGGLSISGLPFTSTSLTNSVGIGREDATSGYAVYGRLTSASTVIAMYYTGATGNATPFQVAAGNFVFSITYFTDL